MSAACAANELASKAKAASPVPKNFEFIFTSPIRTPWIVAASTRRRSHRAQTHALTWDTTGSRHVGDSRRSASAGTRTLRNATAQRATSRTIRWITAAPARESRGNHPQNHTNHLTLAAQYCRDQRKQALRTVPLPRRSPIRCCVACPPQSRTAKARAPGLRPGALLLRRSAGGPLRSGRISGPRTCSSGRRERCFP